MAIAAPSKANNEAMTQAVQYTTFANLLSISLHFHDAVFHFRNATGHLFGNLVLCAKTAAKAVFLQLFGNIIGRVDFFGLEFGQPLELVP